MKTVFAFLLLSNFCIAQNTIVWQVSDTVHHKTSYLVGTYHHIGNGFVDSLPFIKKALLNADIAIFETVDDESKVATLLKKRKEENEIESLLTATDYAALISITKKWKATILQLKPIEILIGLRSEFQLTVCKTAKPTDLYDHFDNYLVYLARQNGIPMIGLESDSLQLEILEDIKNSWDLNEIGNEISYWISKINNADSLDEECETVNSYMKFEVDYEFDTECENDILNEQRNAKWIDTLQGLLSKENCFVAVGLLHLKFKCGLLTTLQKRGFVVTPVLPADLGRQ